MEENKTYIYWGYKIKRKYHYMDAHQHYEYVVEEMNVSFPSLAKAKKHISDVLHGRI